MSRIMLTHLLSALCAGLCLLYLFNKQKKVLSEDINVSTLNVTSATHDNGQKLGTAYNPAPSSQEGPQAYAELYHKLHNLEDFPNVLPTAHQTLLYLLFECLLAEHHRSDTGGILELEQYNPTTLEAFLEKEQEDIYHHWEEYNKRRRSGGPTELFKDQESAKRWLVKHAPLKLVDGAWLGHTHKISTPFELRPVSKNAWQVLSEELGDGELDKNHVHLYRSLLQDVGVHLPHGDSLDFTQPGLGMDDENTWKSAVAQLLVSLFPNDFLPEMLGFNLHYELLTLETLQASKELPEFGISGYYFALHVSIDNADSGHTAMALATVDQYMSWVLATGSISANEAWKRLQAGYLLSAHVGRHRILGPSEKRVINLLRRKASASHRIHCTSKYRIGKQSLADWMAPGSWGTGESWDREFLNALAGARPWVYRGNSRKSLLIRELGWKGKMFGAFTHAEVKELREWIDSLPTAETVQRLYWDAVGHHVPLNKPAKNATQDPASCHPSFPPDSGLPKLLDGMEGSFALESHLKLPNVPTNEFFCLWFVYPCLLENMVNTPYRTASITGSYIVRILRAEYGFGPETAGVAGLDEHNPKEYHPSLIILGQEMLRLQGRAQPTGVWDIFDNCKAEELSQSHALTFARDMMSWSMRPRKYWSFLLGLSRAFLNLEQWVALESELLPAKEKEALQRLTDRKSSCFDGILKELEMDQKSYVDFQLGFRYGRFQIVEILARDEADN